MPSQQGFRCDDTGDFFQEFPAKRLTLYREPTSLGVRQAKLLPAKPSFEDSVLLEPIVARDPHVGFSRATRTMSSRMSFAVGGRPGLRFLLPSYLAAMRWRYQRRSVAGCGNGRNLGQRLAAQSLGLDREPAPLVVRETETACPEARLGAVSRCFCY